MSLPLVRSGLGDDGDPLDILVLMDALPMWDWSKSG
jgi:inorganic pyrophosphatase